ncbi:hypothetical protein NFI96_032399 [Prochilodus magdalenae]|nr:hypothetical protein NFI96_032399 [Prochilodus magdalenae]
MSQKRNLKNTILRSEKAAGLRVRGYNSPVHIKLLQLTQRNCIPVNRDHIPNTRNSQKVAPSRSNSRPKYLLSSVVKKKMFHQFHVQENDRNYLRFLWWKNGDVNTPPHEFRMKVHLFGAVSSPGCANYGLKQLAKEHSLTHPQAAQFIARDFYVDDGVSSF